MKGDLRLLLAATLQSSELNLVSKSYDIIGDIAIIRVPELIKPKSQVVADAVMNAHSNVKTVLRQTGAVSGDFRLRRLEWLAGEKKTTAMHREFGCLFEVDLKRCYFSPRLSFERKRIAHLVQPGETVINMFAGVGCYSIVMAKHSYAETVYSIDFNAFAFEFMRKNVRLNRAQNKVIPVLGDAAEIVKKRFRGIADRVLMPLPEKAYEYLDYALLALKPSGGWVHYYAFVHAGKGENPVEEVRNKVVEKLIGLNAKFDVDFGRVVRATGPNWFQVVLDIFVG
jgi:tRNA (guanine37-N1)-methyltransferase